MKIIDHIGILENFISEEICNEYIEWFETIINKKEINFGGENYSIETENLLTIGREQFNIGITGRNDISLFLNGLNDELSENSYQCLQEAYNQYSKEYPDLVTSSLLCTEIKMQKTPPGGGYHVWHSERMGGSQSFNTRHVAWMIYLNDMPEGEAETEFFHQKLRIQPKAGTVLLWPAGYTHLHRGNTVFTKDKYILTGWFRSVYGNGN